MSGDPRDPNGHPRRHRSPAHGSRRRARHRPEGSRPHLGTALYDQDRGAGHGPGHRTHHRQRARRCGGGREQSGGRGELPCRAAGGPGESAMTTVLPLVLVVDDDPSVRKSLTRLLASAGYAVEAFASAREFLARPPHAGPCCLVLDVRMPGLTGIQLQELLAATGRRMSIVFVSGHVDVKTSVKAMKAGAVDLLTKPVDAKDLIAAIQRAVTRDEHDRAAEARRAEVQRRVGKLTPRETEVFAL